MNDDENTGHIETGGWSWIAEAEGGAVIRTTDDPEALALDLAKFWREGKKLTVTVKRSWMKTRAPKDGQ